MSNLKTAKEIVVVPKPAKADPSNYVVHNNKVWEKVTNALYTVFREIKSVKAGKTDPTWSGELIPWKMWQEMVAWCQVTQDKLKSEALIFLYYDRNAEEGKSAWSYWIPPQITNGMTVRADPDDPRYNKEREAYPDLQFGTLHHHCTMGAFQSGTDLSDEEDREGLHFTIGKVNTKEHDLHARFCIEGNSHPATCADLVAAPDWAENIPKKYLKRVLKDLLSEPMDGMAAWKKFFVADLNKISRHQHQNHNNHNKAKGAGTKSQAYWSKHQVDEAYDKWHAKHTKKKPESEQLEDLFLGNVGELFENEISNVFPEEINLGQAIFDVYDHVNDLGDCWCIADLTNALEMGVTGDEVHDEDYCGTLAFCEQKLLTDNEQLMCDSMKIEVSLKRLQCIESL